MNSTKKVYSQMKLSKLGDVSLMTLGNKGSRNDGPGSAGFNKGNSSVNPDNNPSQG